MGVPLAAWLKRHYRFLWWFCFIACGLPAVNLFKRAAEHDLGVNALATLEQYSGRWAIILLIVSLSITPVRRLLAWLSIHLHRRYGKRLSDWNWVIRLRRMIGLYCAFYATMHAWIYLAYDLDYDWFWAWSDIREKPYLLVGMVALVLLAALAFTSPKAVMRRMGGNWRRLHRSIYLVALLVIVHFWWSTKVGVFTPALYSAVIGVLLGYRLLARFGLLVKQPRDDGMEVSERQK